MPVSKVIYHENINGPFLGDNNNVFQNGQKILNQLKIKINF